MLINRIRKHQQPSEEAKDSVTSCPPTVAGGGSARGESEISISIATRHAAEEGEEKLWIPEAWGEPEWPPGAPGRPVRQAGGGPGGGECRGRSGKIKGETFMNHRAALVT